ncbi:hypothetical protein D3C81_763310 [compost metagenome]
MTNSKQSIADLNDILNGAVEEGILSPNTLDMIDVNDAIAIGSNGMDVDDVLATDVTLVTLITDNSGSIGFSGLEDAVRTGQNEMLDAFLNSKQKDSIMLAQWFINESTPIHSYVSLDKATKLDKSNYNAGGGTPLYDRTVEAVISNVAYAQQLRDTGTPVTSVIIIITDGYDEGSRKYRAGQVAQVIKDVMREQFAVVLVGVGKDDFRKVAKDMGISDGNVLTVDSTPSEIRKACQMVSQSTIRASQTKIDPTNNNSFFV